MMPISNINNMRIGFLNAVFTATSATCVTGLTVLDTASMFSPFGKTVIMFLIQIGGLGIMVLAFFGAFLLGKKLSLKEKMAMSYMLNEKDSRNLSHGVKNIVYLTLFFEIIGIILLFFAFSGKLGWGGRNIFYSLFHSVSAFCNAGFALFPDNLAQFKSNYFVNFIIAGLIIAGGISFIVLMDVNKHIWALFRSVILKRNIRMHKLSLNSRIVLSGTLILLIGGTLLIYKIEHKPFMLRYNLQTQYLMAFFQSVTFRTAGFNTMDIASLHKATYFIMMLFMFIGGASGSIAGGVKINTIGIVWAYIRSIFTNRPDAVISKHSIDSDQSGFSCDFSGPGRNICINAGFSCNGKQKTGFSPF
jgi:trk system potassium uptake protein TrkH